MKIQCEQIKSGINFTRVKRELPAYRLQCPKGKMSNNNFQKSQVILIYFQKHPIRHPLQVVQS